MSSRVVHRSQVGLGPVEPTPEPAHAAHEALRVALVRRVAASPDALALRWKRRGYWQAWAWQELFAEVERAASKLGAAASGPGASLALPAGEGAGAAPGDFFRAIAALRGGAEVVLHEREREHAGHRAARTAVSAADVIARANTLPPLAFDERVAIALLEPVLSVASLCHGLSAAIVHRYGLHVPESLRAWPDDLRAIEPQVLLATGATYVRLQQHLQALLPPQESWRGQWLSSALVPLDPRERASWSARMERWVLIDPLRRALGLAQVQTALWITERDARVRDDDETRARALLAAFGIELRIAGERSARQGALNLV